VIELHGITWDHVRGIGGVSAAAAAFTDQRPDVRIEWTVRSLQAFADQPVDRLAERFDLIVLDHPAIGYAVARGCLVALDEHLDAAFLEEQRASSVGRSAESYGWQGHVWALAIDAAAQVASYRPDLLERCGAEVPRRWDDVVALAERARSIESWVAFPSIPVDAVLAFLATCGSMGEEPCTHGDFVASRAVGVEALELLGRVVAASHPESTSWNPPALLERMSSTDEVAYCPVAFGYSNYARPGFRPNLVRFAPGPAGEDGVPRGTLGGAGLAVSALRPHTEAAVTYARFVAEPRTQRTTYFEGGGQPGHRSAWTDASVNASSSGFFADTLPALDAAYLRPRHDGVLEFQEAGGELIHAWLRDGGEAGAVETVLDGLDERYRESLRTNERTEV
jgi:multiple sugar transport system substrate-binding protein